MDKVITALPFSILQDGREIHFALNIHRIHEVVEQEASSELTEHYWPFSELLDWRGMPVPVVPLERRMKLSGLSGDEDDSEASTGEAGRVIICDVRGHSVGFRVRRTRKVVSISNETIKPVPEGLLSAEKNFIAGVIPNDQGYLYLLDIDAWLAGEGVRFDEGREEKSDHKALAGIRILAVEDSKLFQKRCLQIFEKNGATVGMASNGQQALDFLNATGAAYDLIFTDIEMPLMNGLDMARKIKAENLSDAPILFNSALANPALIQDIENEGLGDYLVKFDEGQIVAKVAELCQKRGEGATPRSAA